MSLWGDIQRDVYTLSLCLLEAVRSCLLNPWHGHYGIPLQKQRNERAAGREKPHMHNENKVPEESDQTVMLLFPLAFKEAIKKSPKPNRLSPIPALTEVITEKLMLTG